MDCISPSMLLLLLLPVSHLSPTVLPQALMLLATKPMQLATYFCTYVDPNPLDWRHYALAVGYYTHFTSPIRYLSIIHVLFFVFCLLLDTPSTHPVDFID